MAPASGKTNNATPTKPIIGTVIDILIAAGIVCWAFRRWWNHARHYIASRRRQQDQLTTTTQAVELPGSSVRMHRRPGVEGRPPSQHQSDNPPPPPAPPQRQSHQSNQQTSRRSPASRPQAPNRVHLEKESSSSAAAFSTPSERLPHSPREHPTAFQQTCRAGANSKSTPPAAKTAPKPRPESLPLESKTAHARPSAQKAKNATKHSSMPGAFPESSPSPPPPKKEKTKTKTKKTRPSPFHSDSTDEPLPPRARKPRGRDDLSYTQPLPELGGGATSSDHRGNIFHAVQRAAPVTINYMDRPAGGASRQVRRREGGFSPVRGGRSECGAEGVG